MDPDKNEETYIKEENAKKLNVFQLKMVEDPWQKLTQKNKSYSYNKNLLTHTPLLPPTDDL